MTCEMHRVLSNKNHSGWTQRPTFLKTAPSLEWTRFRSLLDDLPRFVLVSTRPLSVRTPVFLIQMQGQVNETDTTHEEARRKKSGHLDTIGDVDERHWTNETPSGDYTKQGWLRVSRRLNVWPQDEVSTLPLSVSLQFIKWTLVCRLFTVPVSNVNPDWCVGLED